MVGGLSTTTRFLGEAALRKAAVTSIDAMAKSGKDAPHDSRNRSIAASRSEVEILPKISEVILPQATILTLYLSGLIEKTPLQGSSVYFLPSDLAMDLICSFCSGETTWIVVVELRLSSSVLAAVIHFRLSFPVLLRT